MSELLRVLQKISQASPMMEKRAKKQEMVWWAGAWKSAGDLMKEFLECGKEWRCRGRQLRSIGDLWRRVHIHFFVTYWHSFHCKQDSLGGFLEVVAWFSCIAKNVHFPQVIRILTLEQRWDVVRVLWILFQFP
jgi:hypothetical protein